MLSETSRLASGQHQSSQPSEGVLEDEENSQTEWRRVYRIVGRMLVVNARNADGTIASR